MSGTALRPLISPEHHRFEPHVAFDAAVGEATKTNVCSISLRHSHKGYQYSRRGRVFLVGIDENSYSDYALQWLLEKMVTDNDQVVCVRVVEKEYRPGDKQNLEEAKRLMEYIVGRVHTESAVEVIVEYAFGKLANTFQRLIHLHNASMLVVGTRGHGGIQGLVSVHNSFSKYLLQYSPVPVIVVRPADKRNKKREKRAKDPTRQVYTSMLHGGRHESDIPIDELLRLYPPTIVTTGEEEAHQVAKVLGLPAAYDPRYRNADSAAMLHRSTSQSLASTSSADTATGVPPTTGTESDEEEDEEEEEGEFETMSGSQVLQHHRKEKLHAMEVNEAAALKQKAPSGDDSGED